MCSSSRSQVGVHTSIRLGMLWYAATQHAAAAAEQHMPASHHRSVWSVEVTGEGIMGVHGYGHEMREHMLMQETHLARRHSSMCRPTTVDRLYSLLLYGSSAIQASVTLLLLLRHRIFDAAERQHGMSAIRTGADDTLADSICE